ncbi:MAG: helix-turn-helix transcriptional regulator [Porphyromonadaceae bacterium]|nr:helix-turn-helix transcriptional regulator [Porphyromonadaceae bacterium]
MKISLKAARVNAKFNQSKAAEKLSCDKSSLSKYENGKASPTIDMGMRMAELYGVPFDNIFFGK